MSESPGDLQNAYSNLVDAYKRTELDAGSGLGIFALTPQVIHSFMWMKRSVVDS